MEKPLIGAVVVSYNPSREFLRNIAILTGQVGSIVVVDNTPSANPQTVIDELEHRGGCTVIRNRKNMGIARALHARVTRWGAIIGCAASVLFAIHALGRLSHMSDLGGPVGRIGAMARRLTVRSNAS